MNQGSLGGILYLENSLAAGAFTRDHLEVLDILSSQAAISLENASLYRQLESETVQRMQLIIEAKLTSMKELVAGIAHELRNPLNFMLNFAEASKFQLAELSTLLLTGDPGPGVPAANEDILHDISENLIRICHHGQRANAVIEGMLEHAERQQGVREPADVNAVVARSVQLAHKSYLYEDFEAQLEENYDAGVGILEVVVGDFERIFSNLVVPLLGFNLGVEAGQLALLGIAFIAARMLRNTPAWRLAPLGAAALCGIGVFWFVGRSLAA